MNKFKIEIILILLLVSACSLDTKTGVWNDKKIKKKQETKIKKLFIPEKVINNQLNSNLEININDSFNNKNLNINLSNNYGRYNYDSILKDPTKFKFSKISNFNQNEPNIIFYKNDIIFFDDSGSLIRFNESKDKTWKSNYYSKIEKKSKPFLFLAKNKDTLIVADTIAKYYAVNIKTGNLIWSNSNSSPFNSEIKIFKDKFFIIDYENVLHCYSMNNGKEIWSFKTENFLIKSKKKLSIVIDNNIVYFNNSIGDITAVDIEKGSLIWQMPTQNSNVYAHSFSLKNSDLVLDNKTIYFSNNRNELFSINSETGLLNWKQRINSFVRPAIFNDIIITVSKEGFLIIIDKKLGNIIRITDIFDFYNEKKRTKIYPINFVVGSKNIYLTSSNGRLHVINIKTGKNLRIIKIDSGKISSPFIKEKKLFIIKDKAIIRFD